MGLLNDWNKTQTSISPGALEVRFRETVNHNGAPYRLALTYESDTHFDALVLLDHIPHNDMVWALPPP